MVNQIGKTATTLSFKKSNPQFWEEGAHIYVCTWINTNIGKSQKWSTISTNLDTASVFPIF